MANEQLHVSWFDRFLISLAPDWGLRRVRARAQAQLMARHYEAAQPGRRTSGWSRSGSDANVANLGALAPLRELSRDLRRNNGWARRGIEVIANNSVGWGILPKPKDRRSRTRELEAIDIWDEWADSTACDYDGRLNFYGIQRLVMETVVESGEALILRQPAATIDGLPFPMRLQVLEPDYLDLSRNGLSTPEGGRVLDGIEFDKQGRRVAYWLFSAHPGGQRLMTSQVQSVRVLAERVLHIFRLERPGQVRGVPWLASAIARLKNLDEFEDAELVQQQVAACFGAFVTDMDGTGTAIGEKDAVDETLEHLQPGHVAYLPPGKDVRFATPPNVQDSAFTTRVLRRIAVSLGVPYEELTGDYSQVNYSSARMARLAHWSSVSVWREHMLIPQLCQGVWAWAMAYAKTINGWPVVPRAEWVAPPMPILEPDKEGLAYQRLVRSGLMTLPEALRELGRDPVAQLEEIAATNKDLDDLGIILDVDPRKTTAAGQQQQLKPAADSSASSDGTDKADATANDSADENAGEDAGEDGEEAADSTSAKSD